MVDVYDTYNVNKWVSCNEINHFCVCVHCP